jgi:hypothetical protein
MKSALERPGSPELLPDSLTFGLRQVVSHSDRGFCSDMQPLLRTGVVYDPREAGDCVKNRLLDLLPAR